MRDPLVQLGGFLLVSALVICTPGQDTALTIRNTLAGGRRAGVATGLGVAAGQALWTVAAAAGLVALLAASQPAFLALRLVGAAYLVYLGVQALLAAIRGGGGGAGSPRGGGAADARVALRQGLVSNLANPKMAVFFTSLLPQFAPAGDGAFAVMTALGLLFSALTFAWLGAYSVAVARARDLLGRTRVRRALEAATGAVLVALGLRLAAGAR